MRVYIGAATSSERGGRADGVVIADIDSDTVTPLGIGARGVENPMYLASSADGRVVYMSHAVAGAHVSAWAVDGTTLRRLGRQRSTGGSGACHLSLDPSGRHLLTANYASGTVSVHPLRGDGSLGERTDTAHHVGSGPDAARQAGPHPHMVVVDTTSGDILVPDLGTDTVYRYALDEASGSLTLRDEIRLPAGAGPRHLVVRNGFAYVANELASTVSIVDLTIPEVLRTVPTYVGDEQGASQPSAIRLSGDGRHLYVANRGDDDIAVLSVDGADVRLQATVDCGGTHPRDMVLGPDGHHLYVANQFSDTITSFRIDEGSGIPERLTGTLDTPSPSCILLSPVKVEAPHAADRYSGGAGPVAPGPRADS
ncbi:lactonase family protein [Jiangella endophytica]|uniref:lactonase family protein n=1 Tax=Jiangella endophytica TaxID=1623398 RepID=UPI0013003F7A|nr:lactonase family protein [Jiangella endophytica]